MYSLSRPAALLRAHPAGSMPCNSGETINAPALSRNATAARRLAAKPRLALDVSDAMGL